VDVSIDSVSSELRLGPFRLEKRIGLGGMAAVWSAEHVSARVPAAVKLIHPDGSRAAMWGESLRNEVRALARLDHPAIVPVLDHGEISEEVARASGGRLFAHTPYFVMVRTNAGTLDDAPLPADHAALVRLLVRLLDALSHAHARGVIHRDVKPSNVLLDRSAEGGVPEALLSDFGIAHALRAREAGAPIHAGTPAYMAPEQIAGRMRDEGPATDLYALGCLVHRLVRGEAPFSGTSARVCRAHLLEAPPPLELAWPAPRAFFEWVATMLAKRPCQRFSSAAHARAALLAIEPERDLVAPSLAPRRIAAVLRAEGSDRPTLAGVAALSPDDVSTRAPALTQVPPTAADVSARRPSLWPRVSVIPDWRTIPVAPPRPKLLGAGLGLYGLRAVPLAGREAERDALWSRLVRVHETGRTELVLVRGAAGHGKTRLAEWLVESSLELGAAVALVATHGAQGGPADGLGPMLARHLRARGLERDALARHLAVWLEERGGPGSDRADAEDLAAIVEGRHERFASPRDRHAALRRLVRRIARGQPIVLVLDDVVFGLDALAFLEALRDVGDPLPMLVVATAREEDLTAHSDVARRLEALCRAGSASSFHGDELRLVPLEADAHARLVRELLGLEGALAHEVADRTSGSPLFAVQLVGDWVQRGIVVPGPRGFVLREGAEARIPDDIHGVWRARVAQVLGAVPIRDAQTILELAAALGSRVEINEWRAACAVEGLGAPDAILEAAADAGLLRVGGTSARFVHGMLRESLERLAHEADRLREHHRICALVVEERGGDPERAAHHHLAAGDAESAIPLLFQAIRRHLDVGDLQAAHHAIDRLERALAIATLADAEALAMRARLSRAEALAVQGRVDEASAILDPLVIGALSAEDAAALAWMRGIVRQKRGATSEALREFQEGRARAEALADASAVARCLYGAAECEKLLGRLDDARRHYEAAGSLFHEVGRRIAEARVLTGLSDLEGRVGRIGRALELATSSRAILEELGVRHSVAIVANGIGDLLRKSGRLEEAEASYRDAIAILEELGSADVTFVRINLGLVLLAQGELARADAFLDSVERDFEATNRRAYGRLVRALRLAGAAALRDLARVAAYLDEAEAQDPLIDPDLAWALERAIRELSFDASLAMRAARVARAQWSALGDHEGLARVDAQIDAAMGVSMDAR
jgi:serine/threonine protein kinase/tetratricopeptide (TPR) repeat protein